MFWLSRPFHVSNNWWVKHGSHFLLLYHLQLYLCFLRCLSFSIYTLSPFWSIPFLFSPYRTSVLDISFHLVPTFPSTLPSLLHLRSSPLLSPPPSVIFYFPSPNNNLSELLKREAQGTQWMDTQPTQHTAGNVNATLSGIRPRLVSLMYLP